MEADDPQIKQARGDHHCLCIDGYRYGLTCAVRCTSRRCGPVVSWTTTPPPRVCSLYTGKLVGDEHAKDDANYGWGARLALAGQMYPDTPHQPLFPQGTGWVTPHSNMINTTL